jgi:hypothetical protein
MINLGRKSFECSTVYWNRCHREPVHQMVIITDIITDPPSISRDLGASDDILVDAM